LRWRAPHERRNIRRATTGRDIDMALKVIGSGLGRTGTLSLKVALEKLGFGPCHHMIEVFTHFESIPLWVDAAEGRPNWDALFDGYSSAVDHPSCKFWRELSDYYPHAKVLHSVRDPDAWFESTQATIFAPGAPGLNPPPPLKRFFETQLSDMGEHIHDRDFMVDLFNRNTADVLRTIPKERLLVYEAGQGWEPLCAFLGVPVPDEPYPRENSRQAFAARIDAAVAGSGEAPSLENIRDQVVKEGYGPR
jgi:hypothetical protein